jgi:hypothetical protein
MMLATVETVTKADPVWEPRRHDSDVAAQATARESVHAASPLNSSGRIVYNEPRQAAASASQNSRDALLVAADFVKEIVTACGGDGDSCTKECEGVRCIVYGTSGTVARSLEVRYPVCGVGGGG